MIAEANETRSQERNRKQALQRLRFLLALHVRSKTVPGSPLEVMWAERRRGTRLTAGAESASGPILVAHALNVLHDSEFELKPSTLKLETTSSQLIKFLRSAPQLWTYVNQQRMSLGKKALR